MRSSSLAWLRQSAGAPSAGNLLARVERLHALRTIGLSFQESGKAINEKVRLYAKVGQALIEAKETGSDPFLTIEQILSWEQQRLFAGPEPGSVPAYRSRFC